MLRDAMQELADNISRSHQQRREFLAKTRRETQNILNKATQERRVIARETQREAEALVEALKSSNRSNKVAVAKELREIKFQRMAKESQHRLSAAQSVARNRRNVHRQLLDNAQKRRQLTRATLRETTKTVRTIRMQVQQIRATSKSLTSRFANDISASRRIWSRLRSTASVS